MAGQVVDQALGGDRRNEAQGGGRADAGQDDQGQSTVGHEIAEDALQQRPLQLDVGFLLVEAVMPPVHAALAYPASANSTRRPTKQRRRDGRRRYGESLLAERNWRSVGQAFYRASSSAARYSFWSEVVSIPGE